MSPRLHHREQHRASAGDPATMHIREAEACLRAAGRLLEHVGVTDIESARLARVVFRLAQRVAVDGGRLEAAS
jgi:hypothetical protein